MIVHYHCIRSTAPIVRANDNTIHDMQPPNQHSANGGGSLRDTTGSLSSSTLLQQPYIPRVDEQFVAAIATATCQRIMQQNAQIYQHPMYMPQMQQHMHQPMTNNYNPYLCRQIIHHLVICQMVVVLALAVWLIQLRRHLRYQPHLH